MALLRSVATVGGYTMASRVLGFIRDILTAAFLGAGPVADAFFVAQRLPNLFRSLFAEGAFSAAFVPLFAGTIAHDGKAVKPSALPRMQWRSCSPRSSSSSSLGEFVDAVAAGHIGAGVSRRCHEIRADRRR